MRNSGNFTRRYKNFFIDRPTEEFEDILPTAFPPSLTVLGSSAEGGLLSFAEYSAQALSSQSIPQPLSPHPPPFTSSLRIVNKLPVSDTPINHCLLCTTFVSCETDGNHDNNKSPRPVHVLCEVLAEANIVHPLYELAHVLHRVGNLTE